MKVNIVMLVKDRPKLTIQALRTLSQNTPIELYNLTIVDDGGIPLVDWESYAPGAALLWNGTSKGITGQARNLGVYWAEKYWGRGDWLYLSDNDVYFTPGWLEKLVHICEDPRNHPVVKLLGGWNHPFLQPTPATQKHGGRSYNKAEGWEVLCHDAVTGASQLMEWIEWDEYGPLDAHAPGVGQSEDWKFCQEIIKDGGRVASVYPRVVWNCGITNSFGEAATGQKEMVQELQQAKMVYSDLYWE